MMNHRVPRISQADWKALQRRKIGQSRPGKPVDIKIEGVGQGLKGIEAPGAFMSKLEQKYALLLQGWTQHGVISAFYYETVKLRLAKRTWYTPDFFLSYPDGHFEFHEVKGFRRDDAMIKLKVAAELHRWVRFVLIEEEGHRWHWRLIEP